MRNEESNFNETDILDTSSMDIETVKIGKKNTKESRFVKKHTNNIVRMVKRDGNNIVALATNIEEDSKRYKNYKNSGYEKY